MARVIRLGDWLLCGPTDPARFTERNGYARRIPLGFGWRFLHQPRLESRIVVKACPSRERHPGHVWADSDPTGSRGWHCEGISG